MDQKDVIKEVVNLESSGSHVLFTAKKVSEDSSSSDYDSANEDHKYVKQ